MATNFFFYFIIFIFGTSVGSFLNSIIYRLQTGESFFFKRSFCPHCRHKLGWQDLIPLLSFLILRGKCRYCQKKISWQYPLVELATAILFIFIIFHFSQLETIAMAMVSSFYYLAVVSFLIIIFVYDLKHYIIPDKIIYPAIILVFFYHLFGILGFRISNLEFGIWKPLLNPFLSAILASAFFLAIVLVSRGKWMGLGDFKLAIFMGLFLGFPKILVALFSAFSIGAIIGIGLVLLKKKTLKSEVPFGPFLVTGTLIALFWGEVVIKWYLNFLLGQ